MALKPWSRPALPEPTVEDPNDPGLGWTVQYEDGPTTMQSYAPWAYPFVRVVDIVDPTADLEGAASEYGGVLTPAEYSYTYSWGTDKAETALTSGEPFTGTLNGGDQFIGGISTTEVEGVAPIVVPIIAQAFTVGDADIVPYGLRLQIGATGSAGVADIGIASDIGSTPAGIVWVTKASNVTVPDENGNIDVTFDVGEGPATLASGGTYYFVGYASGPPPSGATNTPSGTASAFSLAQQFTVGATDLDVATVAFHVTGTDAATIDVGFATDIGDGPDSVVWLAAPVTVDVSAGGDISLPVTPITLTADGTYSLLLVRDNGAGATNVAVDVGDDPILTGNIVAYADDLKYTDNTTAGTAWSDVAGSKIVIPFTLSGPIPQGAGNAFCQSLGGSPDVDGGLASADSTLELSTNSTVAYFTSDGPATFFWELFGQPTTGGSITLTVPSLPSWADRTLIYRADDQDVFRRLGFTVNDTFVDDGSGTLGAEGLTTPGGTAIVVEVNH